MNAVKEMTNEMQRLQAAQTELIGSCGYVRSGYRYRYQEITRKIRALKESIEWMKSTFGNQ